MKRVLFLIMLLSLFLILPACISPSETVNLTFDDVEVEINVGDTISVKPNIIGSLSTDEYTLYYELSEEIAIVDEEGNLTAIEPGVLDVFVTININPNVIAHLIVVINESTEKVYKITLDVNGGEELESNTIVFKKNESVELPKPVKEGYVFIGWYEKDVLVTTIKNKNYELVAKWESLDSRVELNYELDNEVYLSNYTSRKEMINDLLADVQSIKGSEYTYEYFELHDGTGYGIFASSQGAPTFFLNESMRLKWGWLLEYVKLVREETGLDVSQYNNLLSDGYVTSDAASINLEIIAFIAQKDCSYSNDKVNYPTSDYSNPSKANGYWETMSNYLSKNNVFKKDAMSLNSLPEAMKLGQKFDGWYTSSDLSSSSKVTASTKFEGTVTLYPKFVEPSGSVNVTFNYDGGVSESLYLKYGTKISSLKLSGYNGGFWTGTNYKNNIYIDDKTNDPKAQFATRIYIAKDEHTEIYKVVNIQVSGEVSSWPKKAEYVITMSGQYNGSYDDNFTLNKISNGDIVVFDKDIKSISSSSLATMYFCNSELSNYEINVTVDSNFTIPTPVKIGYKFLGWYDEFSNKYESVSDLDGMSVISLNALWDFKGQLLGDFDGESWVVKGKRIQLLSTFIGNANGSVVWKSENPEIATVDSNGLVTGVSEGLATIIVCDSVYSDVYFTFYVTVFNENPSGLLKILADSNNESIYNVKNLLIGITYGSDGAYYADIVGSVSKLLFEDYVEHKDYYLSNPSKTSTLTGAGKGGVDFITLHYAADMPYSTSAMFNGGKNLASYNRSASGASWHYSTGNDGVWYCQNTAYGAWHAGSSKTMTWHATGITTSQIGTDIYTPDVTLGNDGYFYLKGIKTPVKNTTGYNKLNKMGLPVKLVGNEWYIGGCYYNSSYGYISAQGGNNNSIGIESSVREGSDLWLTWQYSAQLCANLLLRFELPIQRLVGHHFFTGKWCPQPLIERDLEIWNEFREMVIQEMAYYKDYSNCELSFTSNSEYIKSNGRISSLPAYSECVTYTVEYTVNGVTKEVTFSSILPGTIA